MEIFLPVGPSSVAKKKVRKLWWQCICLKCIKKKKPAQQKSLFTSYKSFVNCTLLAVGFNIPLVTLDSGLWFHYSPSPHAHKHTHIAAKMQFTDDDDNDVVQQGKVTY